MTDVDVAVAVDFDQVQVLDVAAWNLAFEAWLSKKSANTRRAYSHAWQQFRQHAGREPWEVASEDVEAWLSALRKSGLGNSSIGQRLAAISSFYVYVSSKYLQMTPEGERPLYEYNPAAAVERPQVHRYKNAVYLTPIQVRSLLAAIPRDRVLGLRNYALLLMYVATGQRNTEVRTLRWENFRTRGNMAQYFWQGKGREGWEECPVDVWAAITAWLRAAGRLSTMEPDAYLFTAVTPAAGRLPGVGKNYDPRGQAISASEVNRVLRMYARRAGLVADGLKVHSLRHTHAMLLREIGVDTKRIQERLHHASSSTTDGYLHALEGGSNPEWQRVKDRLL